MTKKKTARRKSPAASRARGKSSVAPKAKAKGKRAKPTKKEKRALRPVRRKPTAPDMSGHYRDGRKMKPAQIEEAKATVVRVIAMKGNVREATDSAGIRRSMAYGWRNRDPAFRADWDDAVEEAVDRMEQEAWRRGIEGFDHPVIYQGEITDTYKDYSDALLLTLMRGHRPEKYKDRHELSGSVARPVTLDEETKEDVVNSILGLIESRPDPD